MPHAATTDGSEASPKTCTSKRATPLCGANSPNGGEPLHSSAQNIATATHPPTGSSPENTVSWRWLLCGLYSPPQGMATSVAVLAGLAASHPEDPPKLGPKPLGPRMKNQRAVETITSYGFAHPYWRQGQVIERPMIKDVTPRFDCVAGRSAGRSCLHHAAARNGLMLRWPATRTHTRRYLWIPLPVLCGAWTTWRSWGDAPHETCVPRVRELATAAVERGAPMANSNMCCAPRVHDEVHRKGLADTRPVAWASGRAGGWPADRSGGQAVGREGGRPTAGRPISSRCERFWGYLAVPPEAG